MRGHKFYHPDDKLTTSWVRSGGDDDLPREVMIQANEVTQQQLFDLPLGAEFTVTVVAREFRREERL